MEVLAFGHKLLLVAVGLLGLMLIFCLIGVIARQRRFVLATRAGFYGLFVLIAGASACLAYGFLAGVYNNDYVYNYSESGLDPFFKLAGLWAGLDGSLLFWTLLLAGASAVAALQQHWSARHPSARRMEPYTYMVLCAVLFFFVFLCLKYSPFEEMGLDRRVALSERHGVPLDEQGNMTDGHGLNPQLVNYWFVFHPPTLYLGFVLFTVPFAFALGALFSGELGDYWIRVTRRWSMVAWLMLTCGIVLGGLWAYRQLGWGGYWAWDPVENASFLPWCTATAFLHSVMIQERRDMLKCWNVFLIIFTFFLTIEATYMTRSGEVASVHAFAEGDIGFWFRIFKLVVVGVALLLLFLRFRQLRGEHRLESLLSREAVFFINNLVLVAIAVAVWFLSWLPTNSHHYLPGIRPLFPASLQERIPDELTNQGSYAIVMTPLLALLLFLTAVGPGLGWVRSSASSLRRNFLGPFLFSGLVVLAVYGGLLLNGSIASVKEVFVPKFIERWAGATSAAGDFYAVGLYPTGLFIFVSALIVGTVGVEFFRGMKSRVKFRKEDLVSAFFNLISRDNRRYGGYAVHIGLAVMTVGIIGSSMFKIEKELVLKMGESVQVGDYIITPLEASRSYAEMSRAERDLRMRRRTLEEIEPGMPYLTDRVVFRVSEAEGPGLPVAHGEASRDGGESSSGNLIQGDTVCEVSAERRFYPKQGRWINEVTIHRRLLEDIYVYYAKRDDQDQLRLTVHINPLMMFIWAGWFIMIFGALFALLPISGSRVGLSE